MILKIVNSDKFRFLVAFIVVFNAVILGFEAASTKETTRQILNLIDEICIGFYVFELGLKIYAKRFKFFLDGWNIFDLVIVAVCLVPDVQNLSILRTLRVVLVLRLFSSFPHMRLISSAFVNSISSMASVGFLLFMCIYTYAILCFNLFGEDFKEYFGTLGDSFYTLFQVLTFDSWSSDIVRPIMQVYPYAWVVFISFILIVVFVVLNLAIGAIVNSITELTQKDESDELKEIRKRLDEISKSLKN